MRKLHLYAVFHANLNFSYVPKDLYPQVLRRCYWPLLRIVEEQQVPLGLEFSGYTLEIVNSLDPAFVERLRQLWEEGACEVIGSSYVQAIMPLVPAQVNRENLRLGMEAYERLLGRRPAVAYVNELVYSAGLPRLYQEAGYEAIIANWESALPAHADPELLYRPCAVSTADGGQISLVWHSITAYRDFQRYVEGEIALDEYLGRLLAHLPDVGDRTFPIYCSDWEAFDFKPWRVYPEGFRQPELGEMARIAELLSLLKSREEIKFATPGSLLEQFPNPPLVRPESEAYPLPYKKQEHHGVTRWAVGGRDSVRLNSQCFQLYQELLLADWHLRHCTEASSLQEERQALWKELCFLWNSDFRTFTTEEKYVEFRNRMGSALARVERLNEALRPLDTGSNGLWLTNCSSIYAEAEPVSFTIASNGAHADSGHAYELELADRTVPCQVMQHTAVRDGAGWLTLEAVPALAVGQAGMGMVRELASPPLQRGRSHSVDTQRHIIETPTTRLCLSPQHGGTIETLEFPKVFGEPLICRIPKRSPGAAGLGDDLLPGDLSLRDQLGRSITDHHETEIQYAETDQGSEIFVPVRCCTVMDVGTVWKTYRVYLQQPRVDLVIRFQWRDVVPHSFRLGRMVLNPHAFDPTSLYYATVNGGEDIERFPLRSRGVLQDEPAGDDVTARGCLGATEGWVVLGDSAKGVGFVTRPASLYSVPLVHYEEMEEDRGGFYLTLAYSLGEWDETSHTLWRGHSTWSLSILGGRDDVVPRTRSSAVLSNGGLVARSRTGTDS